MPMQALPVYVVWGAFGGFAGIGALAIPGIFLIGGSLAAILTGGAVGVVAGALTQRVRR